MDIFHGNAGWIEVICGPMFSGKSEELIRRLRRANFARKRVQVFKPAIDVRYSPDEIVSHGDLRMESETLDSAKEMLQRIDSRTEVVGVDEAKLVGAGGQYEARCRRCFEPGVPKQQEMDFIKARRDTRES